jgi:hypothetical protein
LSRQECWFDYLDYFNGVLRADVFSGHFPAKISGRFGFFTSMTYLRTRFKQTFFNFFTSI